MTMGSVVASYDDRGGDICGLKPGCLPHGTGGTARPSRDLSLGDATICFNGLMLYIELTGLRTGNRHA